MREGLRRELLTQKVIEHEVGAKITVTAQEVSDFFLANRNQFNLAEEAYHLAQIVVTPVRDPQVANRTGDDAATPQAAAEKVKMLMERLKAGASFAELAMGYSEDPESAPRGGDLGLVPMSRLKQAPPQLRDAVLNKEPGTVNVASMGGAHTLVLVVAHEPAGQRDLSTPGVKRAHYRRTEGAQGTTVRAAYSRLRARRRRRQLPRPANRRGTREIAGRAGPAKREIGGIRAHAACPSLGHQSAQAASAYPARDGRAWREVWTSCRGAQRSRHRGVGARPSRSRSDCGAAESSVISGTRTAGVLLSTMRGASRAR